MNIIYIIGGVIIGTITGLIPGLHTNNVCAILAISPFFGNEVMLFVLSMSITQAFVESIPSTFLSAPSQNTFEGVLPAHRMLLEGKGEEAVKLFVFGGLYGIIFGIALTPIFFEFIIENEGAIVLITPPIIFLALIIMITSEKTINKKIITILIMIIATTQGLLFKEQIFALITGYFGMAGVLYSLKEKTIHPKQNPTNETNKYPTAGFLGSIGGLIVALLPGLGASTAAGLIKTFKQKIHEKEYLTMIGSISTSNFFFGYLTMFAINKTRNGAMIALRDKIFFTQQTFYIGIITLIIAGIIGAIITLIITKKAVNLLNEKNTKNLEIISIIVMISAVVLQGGITGVIALILSTALGLTTITLKIKRSINMSALIIPTLFFYCFVLI